MSLFSLILPDYRLRSHVVELNFGYYDSDEKQKPTLPCSSNATLNPTLLKSTLRIV